MFFLSCKEREASNHKNSVRKISADLIKIQVEELTKHDSLSVVEDSILNNLYSKYHYHSYWSDSTSREELLIWIDSLYFEGLLPKHYNIDTLKSYHQKWVR